MAKLFAVFDDERALENATRELGAEDYEILIPDNDTGNPISGPLAVANPAGMSNSNYLTQSAAVMVTPLGQDAGAVPAEPEDDDRIIAEALRNGASVLVMRRASREAAQRLRELGASYVSTV
ncbi:MAG: hypothetical protein C4342_01090 [Armatimonadota bacterium]